MAGDPVRDALREAALGVCSPSGRVRCAEPCDECSRNAAAAIAAFLRALPEDCAYTMVPLPLHLAAAVEAAGDEA